MIPVKVDQLFFSNMGFVVLLKSKQDERALPIFIGAAEAQAIALHLNNVKVPRPLTHDLLKNVLDFMECRVKRMEVSGLKEGTFFSQLVLERDGNEMKMDSRPSDAIALALRCNAPIYVAVAIMDEAGRIFSENEVGEMHESATGEASGTDRKKEKLTPVQMLKKQLDKAVSEERYEDAAKLRDEIKRYEGSSANN